MSLLSRYDEIVKAVKRLRRKPLGYTIGFGAFLIVCALFYILLHALDAQSAKIQVGHTNDSTETQQNRIGGDAVGRDQTTDNSTKIKNLYGDNVQGDKYEYNFGPRPYTPIDPNVKKTVIEHLKSAYAQYAIEGTSVIVDSDWADQDRTLMENELLTLLREAEIPSRPTYTQIITMEPVTKPPFVYSYSSSRQIFAEKILKALEPRFDLKNATPHLVTEPRAEFIREEEIRLTLNGHPQSQEDGSIVIK